MEAVDVVNQEVWSTLMPGNSSNLDTLIAIYDQEENQVFLLPLSSQHDKQHTCTR